MRVGMMTVKREGESSEHVSHRMVLEFADTLLDNMGHRGFEYIDITAATKILAAMMRSLNSSQKQVTITKYFPK
jgi:hypothetical protein